MWNPIFKLSQALKPVAQDTQCPSWLVSLLGAPPMLGNSHLITYFLQGKRVKKNARPLQFPRKWYTKVSWAVMCAQPVSSLSVSLRQQTQQELWWRPCCTVIPTDTPSGYAQAHWKINTVLQCLLTPSGSDCVLHIFFYWHLSVSIVCAGFPRKSLHLVQRLCFVRANNS